MTVKLLVNWRGKEILTTQQLDERIDEAIKIKLEDKDCYAEELEEYLDNNYTKMELLEALTDERINKERFIAEIHDGVKDNIRDYIECDFSRDFEEVKVEI